MLSLASQFTSSPRLPLGGFYQGEQQCSFLVWSPRVRQMAVQVVAPHQRSFPLRRDGLGYHSAVADGLGPGTRYFLLLDGKQQRPDPASRFQPEGVHGPTEITEPNFEWQDQTWFGLPLRDYIIYELHVGTFTSEGTFDAVISQLPELRDLGVTAIELMPIAQFPGTRNWGYDGVYPFAAQNSYGGPEGLKRLVNAAHREGLAVILDVVYNHLGPEGNYLNEFGHYFTDRYRTPWGSALNFDGPYSDEVRRFFLENALSWQTEFHIDALRLDAVHAIKDCSALPFLQELARVTHRRSEELNRRFYLFAESDLNDPRLISPEVSGGLGLDAQWSDDFHHALHVLLTGEREGYYEDFGELEPLARALRHGYAYTGQYSRFRKRRHGNLPRLNSVRQFVVFSQNHDQIGNRLKGERLSNLADLEALKLAAGAVLLSPFIPLLFMGEEYGERAPFQYVISHTDPELVEAVRQGRREEFASFAWQGQVPDPQAEATFQECVLNRSLGHEDPHRALYAFYRELLRLRKTLPAIFEAEKDTLSVATSEERQTVQLLYRHATGDVSVWLCFAEEAMNAKFELPAGAWRLLLDSAAPCWGGNAGYSPETMSSPGTINLNLAPKSVLVYQQHQKS